MPEDGLPVDGDADGEAGRAGLGHLGPHELLGRADRLVQLGLLGALPLELVGVQVHHGHWKKYQFSLHRN